MKTIRQSWKIWIRPDATATAWFQPPPEARLFRLRDVRLLEGSQQSKNEAKPLEDLDPVDVETVLVGHFMQLRWQRRLPLLRPDDRVTVNVRSWDRRERTIIVEIELELIDVVDVPFEEVKP